jgi:hypothetical protein
MGTNIRSMRSFLLFVSGVVLGAFISTAISAFGALPQSRMDREYSKFVEDVNGKPAIRVVLTY